ncbi:hypothetical protein QTN47_17045 [Danxiaibacter flavus]|uniref:Uncharacterized protein n=1 Tax=Danxiaibacter flavus TaxID=3049108 RepID=A0ABV3ZJ93_9BACT|nr:hypothetical protein QNM32_17055 [Chitinophagaceae bacterium DXS]
MGFCKYCIHWEWAFTRIGDKQYGICSSAWVKDEIIKDVHESPYDPSAIYTFSTFGCNYFKAHRMNVNTITPPENLPDK